MSINIFIWRMGGVVVLIADMQSIFGAIVGNEEFPPEKQEELAVLHVEIRKSKFWVKLFSCDLIVGPVQVADATGTFYWGAEGSGVSEIPPELSIECHSKGEAAVNVRYGENIQTYPHTRSMLINQLKLFLQNNPRMFPLLQHILKLYSM